jgi:DHA1 family multidrug resistance protein-like MFS transporter
VLTVQVVGQIVYHLSRRRIFQYPEEIEGFVVPEKYRLHTGTETDRPDREDGEGEESRVSSRTAISPDPNTGPEGGEKMIVVDWYGPDDPENPQNWYVPPLSSMILRTKA